MFCLLLKFVSSVCFDLRYIVVLYELHDFFMSFVFIYYYNDFCLSALIIIIFSFCISAFSFFNDILRFVEQVWFNIFFHLFIPLAAKYLYVFFLLFFVCVMAFSVFMITKFMCMLGLFLLCIEGPGLRRSSVLFKVLCVRFMILGCVFMWQLDALFCLFAICIFLVRLLIILCKFCYLFSINQIKLSSIYIRACCQITLLCSAPCKCSCYNNCFSCCFFFYRYLSPD